MIKNASGSDHDTVHSVSDFAHERQKLLGIKQIRSFSESLQAQPEDAPMPDWSDLSIGDRFAIVLRLIPAEHREQLLGKSDSHIRRYQRGLDIPLTVVAALAAETQVPLDWIVYGKAMGRKPATVTLIEAKNWTPAEDVPIQKLAFRASAGNGMLVVDEESESVRFPKAILAHAGVAPQNAKLMDAQGDSMKPTINDGDTLLLDVSASAQQIVEGKIYVFSVGEDAFVKRLRRIGDDVLMISDNRELFPDHETVPKDSPLRIYGRVKWAGRNL